MTTTVLTLLEAAVGVVVVRALEGRGEPSGLSVGDAREVSGLGDLDLALGTLNLADLETLVLGLEEDLVAVKTKEDSRSVLAGWERRQ